MIYRSSDSIRKTLNNVYQNIIKNISAQVKKRIMQISKQKKTVPVARYSWETCIQLKAINSGNKFKFKFEYVFTTFSLFICQKPFFRILKLIETFL